MLNPLARSESTQDAISSTNLTCFVPWLVVHAGMLYPCNSPIHCPVGQLGSTRDREKEKGPGCSGMNRKRLMWFFSNSQNKQASVLFREVVDGKVLEEVTSPSARWSLTMKSIWGNQEPSVNHLLYLNEWQCHIVRKTWKYGSHHLEQSIVVSFFSIQAKTSRRPFGSTWKFIFF